MYLGMDGGGTKTAFVLLDRNGTIRATHNAGSAFYLETGMEALRTLIHEGIRALLRTAGITVAELDYAYFGLPVHGEDERTAELDRLPDAALGSARYACGNDMVCGWAGSLACQDGINVVAGTGSICYGEYRRSQRALRRLGRTVQRRRLGLLDRAQRTDLVHAHERRSHRARAAV